MSFLVNPFRYSTGCDPDAVAFLAAAGITDATITSAICALVTSMKANGTWAKMSAIYPMVGGTATSHKFNLKNPADTNAAFRLTFSGGWTHSANGALPNGTNSYANTSLNPSVSLSLNSTHISYYSRSNVNLTQVEIGISSGSSVTPTGLMMNIRFSGVSYFKVNTTGAYITVADTDSRAFYMANRTASNITNGWKNSTKVATGTIASTSLPNGVIWLGALNNIPTPSLLYYSTKECAFATIGSGLSDAEAAALYTSIQAMQTTLSRNV
jgi:hypothetical protein